MDELEYLPLDEKEKKSISSSFFEEKEETVQCLGFIFHGTFNIGGQNATVHVAFVEKHAHIKK